MGRCFRIHRWSSVFSGSSSAQEKFLSATISAGPQKCLATEERDFLLPHNPIRLTCGESPSVLSPKCRAKPAGCQNFFQLRYNVFGGTHYAATRLSWSREPWLPSQKLCGRRWSARCSCAVWRREFPPSLLSSSSKMAARQAAFTVRQCLARQKPPQSGSSRRPARTPYKNVRLMGTTHWINSCLRRSGDRSRSIPPPACAE